MLHRRRPYGDLKSLVKCMPIFDNLSVQTTLRNGERGRFPLVVLSKDSSIVFRDWLRNELKVAGMSQRDAGIKVNGQERYVERTIAMDEIPVRRALAIATWVEQDALFAKTAAREAHKLVTMIEHLERSHQTNIRRADGDLPLPILMPAEAIVALARAQKAYLAEKGADSLSRAVLESFWTRLTPDNPEDGERKITYREECASVFTAYVAALAHTQAADVNVSDNVGEITTINAALAATAVQAFLKPPHSRTTKIAVAPAVLGSSSHFLRPLDRAHPQASKRRVRHSIKR